MVKQMTMLLTIPVSYMQFFLIYQWKHSARYCAVKLTAGTLCVIRQTTIYIYHNGKISHDPKTGYFACSFFKQQKQNLASDCEVTRTTYFKIRDPS